MKVIRIEDAGFVWHVPLHVVAKHRADYYAANDKDTTHESEMEFVMSDDFEGIDWYQNNMDWENVERHAILIASPPTPRQPSYEAECVIFETE